MAIVNIKFFRPVIVGGVTAVLGVDTKPPESFTSSGTSQVTTSAAPGEDTYVRIAVTGGDVWITTGVSPTAITMTGTLILDGLPEVFKLQQGHKVALIN